MAEEHLVKEFNSEADNAFQSAFRSEKGGDAAWKAVLSQYEVKPLTDEEKQMLLGSSMKIARGAFPIELRRVYEKIISKYQFQTGGNQSLQSTLNNFNMENKVLEYYQKIKPFTGLGDIFKNASTGTAKYSTGLQK